MKKTLAILILCVPTFAIAQKYHKGKIEFADGKTLEGLVHEPRDPTEKKIEFKADETSEKVVHESGEVKKVQVNVDDSTTFEFIWSSFRRPVPGGKWKTTRPQWLTTLMRGPVTLYAEGEHMKIRRNGDLVITGGGGKIPPTTNFFLFRSGEEYPTWVALYSSGLVNRNRMLINVAEYMNDYPELVKRIGDNEFNLMQLPLIVAEYNKWKSTQR